MYIAFFVISLVAGSALCSPPANDKLEQTNHELNSKFSQWNNEMFDWERIKRTNGLPIPKLTKNMEFSEWFELYEMLHPWDKNDYDFKVSLNYYLDEEVVACNLRALKLPYEDLKKVFTRCD